MTETSNEILYCIGCGAKIQSENPNELGYTPESAVKRIRDRRIVLSTLF